MKNLPVAAVIPTHNAAKTLPALLDDLIRQKYNNIFVLDDASTDDTVKVVKSYGSKVGLVENDENVGAGANRNRIIGKVEPCILHFIDADMQLVSKHTPRLIRGLKWHDDIAYFGGLVRNPDGSQNPFNYGPRASLITTLQSWLLYAIWFLGRYAELLGRFLRKLFHIALHDWPNIYKKPRARRTFWTSEANMVIKSDVYERLGGYDPIFRYSEIEDLALRIHRLGLKVYFEPSVDVLHSSMDNLYHSKDKKVAAFHQFRKKHGHLVFIIPALSDYLAGRKTQKRYHK